MAIFDFGNYTFRDQNSPSSNKQVDLDCEAVSIASSSIIAYSINQKVNNFKEAVWQ